MSMPNSPLLPGSKLEQAAKSRSTFSIAAFIFSAHVAVFLVVLLNGCNKENATTGTEPTAPSNQTDIAVQPVLGAGDTNPPAATPGLDSTYATHPPGGVVTFPVPAGGGSNAPAPTLPPPDVGIGLQAPGAGSALPEATGAGSEYKVKSGDIAYNIAKTHGFSLKALKDANPTVDLGKLKVGQTLRLPAGGTVKSAQAPAAEVTSATPGDSTPAVATTAYTVRGGDTLVRIAKKHGTTVKAIRSANNLSGDRINVGQKLKIPARTGNAGPAEALPGTSSPAVAPTAGSGR